MALHVRVQIYIFSPRFWVDDVMATLQWQNIPEECRLSTQNTCSGKSSIWIYVAPAGSSRPPSFPPSLSPSLPSSIPHWSQLCLTSRNLVSLAALGTCVSLWRFTLSEEYAPARHRDLIFHPTAFSSNINSFCFLNYNYVAF